MSTATSAFATLVPSGKGRVLHAFGEEITVLLTGEQTGGKFAVWSEITPPGGGPPPHFHVHEDELFLVQEGRASFFVDGQWQEMGPGAVAFLPRGVVHTFRNVGNTPLRLQVTTSPAGFETFFERCAEEFRKSGKVDMDRVVQISAEYGIHFVK